MCVLTSNEVRFVSLAENCIIFKTFKTHILNGNQNGLTRPVTTDSFEGRTPGTRKYVSLEGACIWEFISHIPALEFKQIHDHLKMRIYTRSKWSNSRIYGIKGHT